MTEWVTVGWKQGQRALRAEIGHSFFNRSSLKVISISATVLKSHFNEKRAHWVQTSACGWQLAPLAVGLALRLRRAFQNVAIVTEEAHHVVQIEAVANCPAVDRAAWMTAANGWNISEENYRYTYSTSQKFKYTSSFFNINILKILF